MLFPSNKNKRAFTSHTAVITGRSKKKVCLHLHQVLSAINSTLPPPSNYTALVGVWIYGFFVMVLLALDFLYYSAINYELCRVYLEKWGLGGRWLKKARSQWNRSLVEESEAQAQTQPVVAGHYQPRLSLRGESHSPTLLPYNTSTAW